MFYQYKSFRLSILVVTCLLFAQSSFALDEWYKALPLLGSNGQIKVDSVITVQDDVFFNPSLKPNQTTYRVKNFVSLKINEASGVLLPDNFSLTIHFKLIATRVDPWGNQYIDSTSFPDGYPYVLIDYNKTGTYSGHTSWAFDGAYRAELRITSIDTMAGIPFSAYASALMIENEMIVSREYNFSCSANAITTVNTDSSLISSMGELRASWPKDKMADEYDLEWAYIDSSALGNYMIGDSLDVIKIFANNATRISISQEEYNIPVIYDNRGKLFFRVRPVQIKYSGQRVEAAWSSEYSDSGGLGHYDYAGHERALNWQSTTSFAEEGKRKTVVQYFDGSLRNRQTVTKDNSTNTTVVAETFYDKQGRPAIQVLPAPTLNTLISYSRNFNNGLNGVSYDKNNYDTIADPAQFCNASGLQMDTASGASLYYSAANPQKDSGFHRFIPHAAGYPFAETEYMPDNTGRIRQQGGVGAAFRLNSGHQTTYYYGSPDQKELDAMFGTEAGDYTHYFKTMVKDANGQFSVSYTDMHGRTIATSLAGTPPSEIVLDTLLSRNTRSITEALATPSNTVVKDLVMESKKGLLVAKPGIHSFNYALDPQLLQKKGCDSVNVCYNCLYDLEITITDDCNNQRLGGQAFDTTLHNFSLASIDTACTGGTAFSFNFNRYLEEGSYEITKRLSVSRYGMDYYRDSFFVRANTCRDLNSFVNEQRTLLASILQCKPTCTQCMDSLGTLSSFTTRFKLKAGIDDSDTSFNSLINQAYIKAGADCDLLCNKTNEYTDIRQSMLMDLTPPSGQYANADSLKDIYSIFYFQDKLQGNDTIADFRKPASYLDENGKIDTTVYDEQAGAYVRPQKLSRDAFASKFKLSWAESLLPYHPEYCKLQQYEALKPSLDWDRKFEATDTYAEAISKGYLNPTNNTGSSPYNTYNATVSAEVDPITTFSGHNYVPDLENALTQYRYITSTSTYVSLWALATATTKCTGKDNSCFTSYYGYDSAFNNNICTADLDMAWRTFRALYLNVKKELINAQLKLSPCNTTPSATVLTAAHHQSYFLDGPEAFSANGIAMPTTVSGATSQVNGAANDYYTSNCRAYVQMWWEQLQPCGYTNADTAIIMRRLIQVCSEGSDLSHPYGASSVKPSSANYYRNFEDVINGYNDSLRTAAIPRDIAATKCNAFLISAPGSYETPVAYSNVPVWKKPDSCMCTTINGLYDAYTSSSEPGDTSFAAYLYRTAGTVMTNSALDSLRHLCNNTLTCVFLVNPINVPPALQCGAGDVCVSCAIFSNTYNSFKASFPGVEPSYDNSDSTKKANNNLFQRFMNNKLGFTKQWVEYLKFKDTCNAGVSGLSCDSLRDILSQYALVRSEGVIHAGNDDYLITDLSKVLANGILGPGDSVRNLGQQFYLEQSMSPKSNLCFDSSYAVEYRFKFPRDGNSGTDFYMIASNTSIGGELRMLNGAAIPGLYLSSFNIDGTLNGCSAWGYYVGYPSGDPCDNFPGKSQNEILIAPGVNVTDQWTTLKIRVSTYTYQLYCNGVLVLEIPGSSPGPSMSGQQLTQLAFNAASNFSIDYIKFWGDDKLIYNEEFNDPQKPAVFTGNLCYVDCQSLFASYFNSQKGTGYTYAQIEALYRNCAIPLAVCPGTTGPMLCGRNEPIFPPVSLNDVDNCSDSSFFAVSKGTEFHNIYTDSLKNNFDSLYRRKCLQATNYESFTVTREVNEYHYTLYYYDQAGNLLKTVPPAGVDMSVYGRSTYFDSVTSARATHQLVTPNHALATNYRYNTLNQVVAQVTPDAGLSNFWYDRLGRLSVSQNARQKASSVSEEGRQYSYTVYDYLGRIGEVGQLNNTSANGTMSNSISRSQTLFNDWLLNLINRKEQVTRTYYDLAYPYENTIPLNARNLRNRVSYTTITNDNSANCYNAATFYSYDIHGNVDTLLQDYGGSGQIETANIMNRNGNRWVRMVYKYDLISGKVNQVAYNPRYYDITIQDWVVPNNQFYHRYSYDAENRITSVETSSDSVIWDKDARYEYYKHGPLARTLIGDQQVQGLDYAYTLQGWLKGLNSTSASATADMGEDGKTGTQNINIARDLVGYNLNYYSGDYAAIHGSSPFPNPTPQLTSNSGYRPLFNGNISSMAVNIKPFLEPFLYNYKYDQLNRLTGMDAFTGLDTVNNNWTGGLTPTMRFNERVSYDGNGNIQTYNRYFTDETYIMDQLVYHYQPGTNKLNYVHDDSYGFVNGNYKIKNQDEDNYEYDEIGNLIKDNSELIASGGIKWNVYGKITEVNHSDAGLLTNAKKINYYYDAAGNRIGKRVVNFESTQAYYTWYVRDAQGNVMHTYTASGDTLDIGEHPDPEDHLAQLSSYDLIWSESHLYGSGRLGVLNQNAPAEVNWGGALYYGGRGSKFYEISNHLGNVLAVITDKKIGHTGDGTTLDYYDADVVKVTDYYPFGMVSRNEFSGSLGMGYRYGFNGKENDADVKGDGNQVDYGMRIYDPRLGRFLSVDPLTKGYPSLTPYQYASGNPIAGIDKDGGEFQYYSLKAVKENGKALLKTDKLIATTNYELDFKLTGTVSFKAYPLNPIPVPITLDQKFEIPFSLSYSDLGIKRDLVSVDGKSWLVLPPYFDVNDLPSLNDEVWHTLVTSEDYQNGIEQTAHGVTKTVNFILDHADDIAALANIAKGKLKKDLNNKVNATQPNNTKGWTVGDPLNNLTKDGKVPKWSTVRSRYWKNRANSAKDGEFDQDNLDRMKKGSAPRRVNEKTNEWESKELHHTPPQRDGGKFDIEELWPDEHAAKDPYRKTGN